MSYSVQRIVNKQSQIVNPYGDLKKQSQFAGGQMDVKSSYTTNYDDFAALGLRKNQAKTKHFQDGGSHVEWIPAFAGMTSRESLERNAKSETKGVGAK